MFKALHVARETPDYILELEEWDEGVLVHFRFFHFNPTVLRQCHAEWKLFRQAVQCPLFCIEPRETQGDCEKFGRFVKSFGFRPHAQVLCNNGVPCQMYIHTTIRDGPEFTIH